MRTENSSIAKLTHALQAGDESGLELLRLLQLHLFGRFETDEHDNMISNIPKSDVNDEGFHAIGTWHPVRQKDEVVFKRKEQIDSVFWESTCDQFCLRKKEGDKRVCVIGESAAAGMFFTPYITPAKVLNNYLKTDGNYSWEVIDLTRNCMNAGALIETCGYALQLEPDYIVIIAGNNWFSDIMVEHNGPLSRRRKYVLPLEKDGVEGVITAYQESAGKLADRVMSQIENLASNSPTKFIFAIPALNYSSWVRRVPLHWLNNEKTIKWYEYYKLAAEALDKKEYHEAFNYGKKMIEIDNGSNSASCRILADCCIALGKDELAYQYCVSECDNSLIFDEITSFPAVPSFVRKKYDENNRICPHIKFLDFEKVLEEYFGTKVLGQEVFVDYCHLNPEGFHIVMAPVANLILSNEKNTKEDWISLVKSTAPLKINQAQLAVSYFSTALYNTHLNRPVSNKSDVDWYSRLFQKAVDSDRSVLEIMKLYIMGRSCEKGAGFTLSKAGQKLFELMNSPLDFPVAQEAPGADALTVEAICNTLENNGWNGKGLLNDYQQPYIQALESGIDLTEPAYIEWLNSHLKMSMDSENGTRRRLPFYQSWWPLSFFTLAADGEHDLSLDLTCRLPVETPDNNQDLIRILINDQEIKAVTAQAKWTNQQIDIPAEMLKKGFNRLAIEWPVIYQNESQRILQLAERYCKGLNVDFFPVLGEIHSLIVRKV